MELLAGIIAAALLAGIAGFFAGQLRAERKVNATENELNETKQKLIAYETEMRLLASQSEEKLQMVQQHLPEQFENLAAKILEQSSQKLSKTSEENLGQLLNPLKEKLAEFQKKVDETYQNEARERHSLKDQIKQIVDTNEKMRLEAESLTNALRGSNKTQGNWGEHVLTMLLESSGLREGEEFITQGRDMKLTSTDGSRLQPDVVIKMPDNKHFVIDSKVSLLHYEKLVNAADDAEKEKALNLFLSSVRGHVKGLSEKDYSSAEGLSSSPDFVFMFMPIEGAYMLAIQSDKEIQSFAWERKVVPVSPSTLMPILKIAASIWRLERQNQNTAEIARQGGALYDKFVGFVESMKKIGERLNQANDAYNDAFGKLKTGNGNLITRTEKLRELGAKTSKTLPENLLNEAEEDKNLLEKVG